MYLHAYIKGGHGMLHVTHILCFIMKVNEIGMV